MSSLAAFLTGITSLCIHHHEAEAIPGFFRRIDRNLHHLLHLESGLPAGRDPLSGAYTIDFYSGRGLSEFGRGSTRNKNRWAVGCIADPATLAMNQLM
jgi:hypothetical protein